jgi:hypothetical protein
MQIINEKGMNHFTRSLGIYLTLFLLGFTAVSAQQMGTVKVGGPCSKCSEHILSVTRSIDGVKSATYDASTNLLNVQYDAGTSLLDIALELSIAGYDAGDFRRDAKASLPPCCQASTRGDVVADTDDDDLFEDIDDDNDWENPDNLDALDRLSEHKVKSGISDEDLDLLDDEDDDDDLLKIDDDDRVVDDSDDDDE